LKYNKIIELSSTFLKRKVQLELFNSDLVNGNEPKGLLLLNDGQLAGSLFVQETIEKLRNQDTIIPIQVVAIHAGERQAEYGVTGMRDFMGRGAKAGLYESFIIEELLPWLNLQTSFKYSSHNTAFAGFSLGGLSAFDIVTSNPSIFSSVGVFSGSLWWRSKSYENGYTENDRIVFNKMNHTRVNADLKCYLMAGTNDECNDRNGNGVIDSVDDTLDMFDVLSSRLRCPEQQLLLSIVNGGCHNPATWSQQFPEFLVHTFGTPY